MLNMAALAASSRRSPVAGAAPQSSGLSRGWGSPTRQRIAPAAVRCHATRVLSTAQACPGSQDPPWLESAILLRRHRVRPRGPGQRDRAATNPSRPRVVLLLPERTLRAAILDRRAALCALLVTRNQPVNATSQTQRVIYVIFKAPCIAPNHCDFTCLIDHRLIQALGSAASSRLNAKHPQAPVWA